jgi:hypothetical protein
MAILRRRYREEKRFFLEPLSLWESDFGKYGGEGKTVAHTKYL